MLRRMWESGARPLESEMPRHSLTQQRAMMWLCLA